MVKCEICEKELKSLLSLGKHLKIHEISLKDYYDNYIESEKSCENCGGKVLFKSLTYGYSRFCSLDCAYKFRTGKPKEKFEKPQCKIECLICGHKVVSYKALSQHIINHNISSQEYYDKYLLKDENEKVCEVCNGPTKFKNIKDGYQKYCSSKCCNLDKDKIENSKKRLKKFWASEECEETKGKIRKTVKNQWEDESSIFNSETYRDSLSTGQNNRWNKYRENMYTICEERTNFELLSDYKNAHSNILVKCKDCEFEFETIWNYLQYRKGCPQCYINGISLQEFELLSFVKSILPDTEIISNSRKIIPPQELDIYIPNKNIAIEYNGLWFHSEDCEFGGKDEKYHISKTVQCSKKDITLIHIFEDEWLFKQDIVKNRLLNILGESNKKKIYARKCIIREIDSKVKNNFLDKFHLQGKDSSIVKLGAFYNDILVSVMTFSHGNIAKGSKQIDSVWELNRFCSDYNYNVVGIASKFLSCFKKDYEWGKIFSYADRRWSIGNLYYKLGFDLEYITKPNYWYLKRGRRIHRFALRKTSEDDKNIPERILRKEQGYSRIWDCGNLKFSILNGG